MTGGASGDNENGAAAGRGVAAQLVCFAVFVAAILVGTATFLSFLGSECARGTPHLTQVFVCFPGR